MPRITYISHDGETRTVDAVNGRNLMETALASNVPGIDGDCGGVCACATCHVHVDAAWMEIVGEADMMERDMLEATGDVRPTSRLACQIVVSDALDGLVVRTPEVQGY